MGEAIVPVQKWNGIDDGAENSFQNPINFTNS